MSQPIKASPSSLPQEWVVVQSSLYLGSKHVATMDNPEQAKCVLEVIRFLEIHKGDVDSVRKAGDRLADHYATLVAVTARSNIDVKELPAIKEWRAARHG